MSEIDIAEIERMVLEAIEPYTRVSSLHNYGPSGLSREEKAEIRTGQFVFEDVKHIFSLIRPQPKIERDNDRRKDR